MTEKHDSMSPRLAAALFFAVYALLVLILAKYILLSLNDKLQMSILPVALMVMMTGFFAGALFGNFLARPTAMWRILFWGALLALVALLQISLGIFIHAFATETLFFKKLASWYDYFVIYGLIFISVSLIVGLWLVPLTSLVAVFFNRRFFPGLVLADEQRQAEKDAS